MADISELDDDAVFLKATWKRAFDYHTTFVKRFTEVKLRLDRGEFPEWSSAKFMALKCGLSEKQVIKMATVYQSVMGEAEREMLRQTAELEKRQRREQQLAGIERQKQLREEVRRQRAALEAQKRADKQEQADARAVKAIAAKERQQERQAEQRRAKARDRRRQQKVAQQQQAVATGADVLDHLAAQIKAGQQRADKGRVEWQLGTMQVAVALATARAKFTSDHVFGDWLIRNDINYNPNDRSALINMGLNAEISRTMLEMTERRSLRLIWENEIGPEVEKRRVSSATNPDEDPSESIH